MEFKGVRERADRLPPLGSRSSHLVRPALVLRCSAVVHRHCPAAELLLTGAVLHARRSWLMAHTSLESGCTALTVVSQPYTQQEPVEARAPSAQVQPNRPRPYGSCGPQPPHPLPGPTQLQQQQHSPASPLPGLCTSSMHQSIFIRLNVQAYVLQEFA